MSQVNRFGALNTKVASDMLEGHASSWPSNGRDEARPSRRAGFLSRWRAGFSRLYDTTPLLRYAARALWALCVLYVLIYPIVLLGQCTTDETNVNYHVVRVSPAGFSHDYHFLRQSDLKYYRDLCDPSNRIYGPYQQSSVPEADPRVLYPAIGNPALVFLTASPTLTLVVSGGYTLKSGSSSFLRPSFGGQDISITLQSGNTFDIPSSATSGLYDLYAVFSDNSYSTVPHAVQLYEKFRSPYKFVLLSDIHIGEPIWSGLAEDGASKDYHLADLLAIFDSLASKERPDFIIITGDFVNGTGGPLYNTDYDLQYQAFKWALLRCKIPVFLTAGNHDEGWMEPGVRYITAFRKWLNPAYDTGGEAVGYEDDYSFNYGGDHFVVVDSGYGPNTLQALSPDQVKWMKTDIMDRNGNKRTFVFSHAPVVTDTVGSPGFGDLSDMTHTSPNDYKFARWWLYGEEPWVGGCTVNCIKPQIAAYFAGHTHVPEQYRITGVGSTSPDDGDIYYSGGRQITGGTHGTSPITPGVVVVTASSTFDGGTINNSAIIAAEARLFRINAPGDWSVAPGGPFTMEGSICSAFTGSITLSGDNGLTFPYTTSLASGAWSGSVTLSPGVQVATAKAEMVKADGTTSSNTVFVGIVKGDESYYGHMDVGSSPVAVVDPKAGFTRLFKLADIDSHITPYTARIEFTTNQAQTAWDYVVVAQGGAAGPDASTGGSGTLGPDVGFFIYAPTIWDSGGYRWAELMIAPHVFPGLDIRSPLSGQTVDGAVVRVTPAYAGQRVPWKDDAGYPPVSTDAVIFKKLCYNDGTSNPCSNGETYAWTMSGSTGDRTMTVTLTDLFGRSVSRSVTVTYVPCVGAGMPAAPTFPGVTCRSLTLNWNTVMNASGYQVQRSPAGCGSWANIGDVLPADAAAYTDKGLAPGVIYCYRVVALGCTGNVEGDAASQTTGSSGAGGPVCATPGVPGTPTFPNVGTTTLSVNWSDVMNEKGYRVQRSLDGSNWTTVSLDLNPGTTTFTDYGLAPATTYWYRIVALAEDCCEEQPGQPASKATNAVIPQTTQSALTAMASTQSHWACDNDGCGVFTATITGYTDIFGGSSAAEFSVSGSECHFTSYPGTPGETPVGSREAILYLTDGTNQVEIFRQSPFNSGFSGAMKVVKNPDGTFDVLWNGATLHSGLAYPYGTALLKLYTMSSGCYDVSCGDCQVHYHSGYAALSTGSVSSTACADPGVPAKPDFPEIMNTMVTVHWTGVPLAAGYLVQRRIAGSGNFVNVSSQLSPQVTSYTDTGLNAVTGYEYRIVALAFSDCRHQAGAVALVSTAAGCTTDPGVPAPPEFTNIDSTRLTVNWTDVGYDVGYQVQRCTGAGCTSFSTITDTPLEAGRTFYDDSGLSASMTYRYRIIAKAAMGCADRIGAASADVTPTEAWFDPGWHYRRPVSIAGSTSPLGNYQVAVTVDTLALVAAGHMRTDGGDIRFTDSTKTRLLGHWLESGPNTASTRLWVKVPSIPVGETTIYMYYGNPFETYNNSNGGNNTFRFFDDFNTGTSTDSTKWAGSSGAISDGVLTFDPQPVWNLWNSMVSIPGFEPNLAVRTRANVSDVWAMAGIRGAMVYGPDWDTYEDGGASRVTYNGTQSMGTWHTFDTLYLRGASLQLLVDGVQMATRTPYAGIGARTVGFSNYSGPAYSDWILVRNYASPEPSTTIGAEEAPPTAPTGLTAAGTCTGVDLSWTASSGATSYEVWRTTISDCTTGASNIGSSAGTTYSDSTAAAGTPYYYTVKTVNACGTSGISNCANAARLQPAAAPSITGITDNNACAQDGIKIAYTAGTGATSHNLFKDGAPAVTNYTSGALYNPGDTARHSYVVRAVKGPCTTDSAGSALTDAGCVSGAPAPIGPGNGGLTFSAATLAWSSVSGASSYQVQVATDAAFSAIAASVSGLTSTGWAVSPLLNQTTTYYWRVRETNGACNCSWSAVWTFITPARLACGTCP